MCKYVEAEQIVIYFWGREAGGRQWHQQVGREPGTRFCAGG